MITDVIVIGGGAAGLYAAVYLKQKSPNLTIRVLERLPRVCKKLSVTGNGRCNISNKEITLSRYHGKNVEFCDGSSCNAYDVWRGGVPRQSNDHGSYHSCNDHDDRRECV